MDRGFLYGDGFFETILAVDGVPEFLEDHLKRLGRSCEQYHLQMPIDRTDWPSAVHSVLEANRLLQGFAAVKIVVTRGIAAPGLNLTGDSVPTLLIMARVYSPPSKQWDAGMHLVVFPLPHATPLAHHKSLNYLYYLAARQYALDRQADEAIILDEHGRVLECAAANIFVRSGNSIAKPPREAPYLKGVIENRAVSLLEQAGFTVSERYYRIEELDTDSEVLVTNSLIRVVPVAQIQGIPYTGDRTAANILREKLCVPFLSVGS